MTQLNLGIWGPSPKLLISSWTFPQELSGAPFFWAW